MKQLFLSIFFLTSSFSSVIAATNSFDPVTRTLTMDSVTVPGDRTYSNVVIRVDQFTVLGVGSSAPINNSVSETCGSENFTIDKFNAIQIGMSLDQVNQIIGCESDIVLRNADFLSYDWTYVNDSNDINSISVIFDSSSLTVFDRLGSGFKSAIGF